MVAKCKIKKGDNVVVIAGKDKGKSGEVVRVFPEDRKVIVSGVNMVKRHMRPSATQPGGIIQKESRIHISNIALVDPKSEEGKKTPTKVGFKTLDNGKKVRIARRSKEVVDN